MMLMNLQFVVQIVPYTLKKPDLVFELDPMIFYAKDEFSKVGVSVFECLVPLDEFVAVAGEMLLAGLYVWPLYALRLEERGHQNEHHASYLMQRSTVDKTAKGVPTGSTIAVRLELAVRRAVARPGWPNRRKRGYLFRQDDLRLTPSSRVSNADKNQNDAIWSRLETTLDFKLMVTRWPPPRPVPSFK
jgi:hypothetical protein